MKEYTKTFTYVINSDNLNWYRSREELGDIADAAGVTFFSACGEDSFRLFSPEKEEDCRVLEELLTDAGYVFVKDFLFYPSYIRGLKEDWVRTLKKWIAITEADIKCLDGYLEYDQEELGPLEFKLHNLNHLLKKAEEDRVDVEIK